MPSLPKRHSPTRAVKQPTFTRQEYDARRGTSTERGYDWDWQTVRRAFLNAHPLCWGCMVAGRYTTATQVDHRVKFRNRPELRLDWDNLQPLCNGCHGFKSAWERAEGL